MTHLRTAAIAALFLMLGACDAEMLDPQPDGQTATPGKGDSPWDPDDTDTFVGVLPDFATVRGISTHVLLRELAPAFVISLRNVLGDRLIESTTGFQGPSAGYSRGTSAVWTRDYFPLVVGTPEGRTIVSYLSVDQTRSDYTGADYAPINPPEPGQQWYRNANGVGGEWWLTESMPLLHENGNLVSTGKWLILTDRVIRQNTAPSTGSDAAHLRTAGWSIRNEAEVLEIMSRSTRTPVERIIVLPPMPGEKTDHVDLFVMALSPDEVMVPELRDDILDLITYGHEIELGWRVREHLDAVAETLAERGITVHRLPMLAPVFLEEDAREITGYNAVAYSPTNAMQLRLAGEQPRIWLPTFAAEGFPDEYIALAASYEEVWQLFFEARGMAVELLDATELGRAYGLFHCVTSPAF